MKLSEKIIELRKVNGMTQEELAAICNVSRQSISKWEADIALPETEKLLILGDTFRVSMDILLKDELTLNEAKDVHSCGSNAIWIAPFVAETATLVLAVVLSKTSKLVYK